jgi:putative ABC transport system ATP-binding protein
MAVPVMDVRAHVPARLRPAAGEYLAVTRPADDGGAVFRQVAGWLAGPGTGLVGQVFHLLPHRSVVDNVLVAMVYRGMSRADRRDRAAEALDQVGLGRRAETPAGLLPAGERRRVAVARALVNRPGLLLCEEPTAGLDPAATVSLLRVLDRLPASGRTLVVVSRDGQLLARAGRVIQMPDDLLVQLG